MRLTHVVSVDYTELASYLQQHHDPESQDDPLPHATFKYNRGLLAQHVEQLMNEESPEDDNPSLTQILLRNHRFGSITEIMVSLAPGRVVQSEGRHILLPAILIKIDY